MESIESRGIESNASYPEVLAKKLQYGANEMRGVMWSSESHFMMTWGFLDRPMGSFFSRGISAITLFASVFIGISGQLLLGFSHRLQSKEYTYWRGEGEENLIAPEQTKVMHLNACMFPGSLPYQFGKMSPASERMGLLIQKVQNKSPDILFLCEFSPVFSGKLYKELKGEYKHFFVNIGSCALGMDASMAVLSKVPILNRPKFIPTRIEAEGDQKWMYRGYFVFETKGCNYLYAHLHPPGAEGTKEIRKNQLDEIRELTKAGTRPWVIVGDLNIDRNKPEYQNMNGFNDTLTKETITYQENGIEESIDYIVTPDDQLKIVTEVEKDLTLSDHSTLVAMISLGQN